MLERIWYWDVKQHVPKPIIKALCDHFDCMMEYTRMLRNPPAAIRTLPQIAQELDMVKNEIEKVYSEKNSKATSATASVSPSDASSPARKGTGSAPKKAYDKN